MSNTSNPGADQQQCLVPTATIDSDHSAIIEYTQKVLGDSTMASDTEKAIRPLLRSA